MSEYDKIFEEKRKQFMQQQRLNQKKIREHKLQQIKMEAAMAVAVYHLNAPIRSLMMDIAAARYKKE